ncbi:MAG TPA: DNA repair exonuclease [Candidatus Polarisedimenticolia bacterium]|jgi:DNA repair exonuclease SbcCD nuclease subunit
MASIRFLQMSDLHLDSSLQSSRLGLPQEKLRVRQTELRQILPKACALARERGVDLVLLPGDLFDDEAVTQDTVNLVIDHLGGLAPIPVVIAPGNHDFYSLGSPYNDELLMARKQRPWPRNVRIFRDGHWRTLTFPELPGVRVTGMAHSANALLGERLLALPIPREGSPDPAAFGILVFHGSRDNARIPGRKMRTLPFSDTELASQGFDYTAIGHYHDHAIITSRDGRILGAYSGCPAGRGLDEEGEKHVLVGEIVKEGPVCRVAIEKVRLDRRAVRCVDVNCSGATHRDAVVRKIEEALGAREPSPDDLVHLRLTGRIAPGIDVVLPEGLLEDRFFHVSVDLSLLKPDYNLERYREEKLQTTEARFAREMLRRIDAESDPARRRLLESALYYGLDALIQKEVRPRYEERPS